MKKIIITTIVLIVIAGVIYAVQAIRDERHWRKACRLDSVLSYGSFLVKWPDGKHAIEARSLYSEREWSYTKKSSNVLVFKNYIQTHPKSRYVPLAKKAFEELTWETARTTNTYRSLQKYIDEFPSGKYLQEAKTLQESLLEDDTPFLVAKDEGSEKALETFVDNFPGHTREPEAKALLSHLEKIDIVDLLNKKVIEAQATAKGFQNVSIKIRSLVSHSVTVRIPAGTCFIAKDRSFDNLISRTDRKRTLPGDDRISLPVPVVCKSIGKKTPDENTHFMISKCAREGELFKLARHLSQRATRFEVHQAAVWIVSVNADYEDLGYLIIKEYDPSLPQWATLKGRAIKVKEAAKAMKICKEAGIEITKKKIWKDRKEILAGLQDGELKKWLNAYPNNHQ